MDFTFTPRAKTGAPRKYDWDALIDPGYFFVPAETWADAKRVRGCVLSSLRNNPKLQYKITTSIGQATINGVTRHGVLVKRA